MAGERGSPGGLWNRLARQMNGTNGSVQMPRDEVDRLVLMRMDLDRYEAQMIPDLQQRVLDLTRALKSLVASAGDSSLANRAEALATARRVLGQSDSGATVINRF